MANKKSGELKLSMTVAGDLARRQVRDLPPARRKARARVRDLQNAEHELANLRRRIAELEVLRERETKLRAAVEEARQVAEEALREVENHAEEGG